MWLQRVLRVVDTVRMELSEQFFTPNHDSLSLPTAQLCKQNLFPKSFPHTHGISC